jgi:hypothetical protein
VIGPVFVQLGYHLVNYHRIGFVRFYPKDGPHRLHGDKPLPHLLIDFCMGSYGNSDAVDTACLQFYGEEAQEIWHELKKVTH